MKTAVWSGDLCTDDLLTDVGLLTNQIQLVWKPPNEMNPFVERKIVLTAVGQGKSINAL